MTNPRSAFIRGGLCLLLSVLAACSDNGGEGDRPAQQVGYVVVQPTAVPVSVTLGGRTVAYETSEVRPQINGLIRRRLFTEGSVVRAGQPLYEIDASLYRAAVNQAEANLASARASADAAVARADRYKPLAEMEAIAQQDYTDAAAQARVARAGIAQNSAALDTARINLRYTTVTAPIGGRIGRSLYTVGALVNASQASPLAVIQRLDPIFVDMQQSSAELTSLRQALQRGEVTPGSTSVHLLLEDGSDYGVTGQVKFSDIAVDESTGTVTLRASFPNPQGLLLPGMFVKAVFDQAVEPRAFLVPQPALQRDFDGSAFVYVVTPDNKAQRRKVTAVRTNGTNWVVTAGLEPGDKVITQGLGNNLRPDSEVKAVPASAPQNVSPPGRNGGGKPASGKAR
ncbi:efflux RND transporter periplasmic adaptor subunit [Altererythrobacter sp. Root672]|uniref:efflux RND transporter periplasmic adaptor subunit n=1 Tax=Altererythrobacter sp. Root672 TaxID=1736584 RepID=UPI0006FA0686|nr:efflux RND transporter periplasmic adaptor subunit [Altererythrobacter sp. Root672]KRA84406.1 hemolysin D [Altererythrobacter sp. Root672]